MAMVLTSATILVSLFFTSSAQTCSNHTFKPPKTFNSCKDLPYLKAYLHWTYFEPTKQVKIAFRARHAPERWTAWAINPDRRAMVGSRALVALRDSQGKMSAYTTIVTGYNPSMQPRRLDFRVSELSSEYVNGEMTIYALVGPLVNGPVVNHVWQVGSLGPNGVPQMHEMGLENLESIGVVDFSV